MTTTSSYQEQALVEQAMRRRVTPLSPRERRVEALMGGGLVLVCAGLVLAAPPRGSSVQLVAGLAAAAALGLAMHVRFYVGTGYTVPTQLAFVPLAFTVPAALLPPVVALVLAASQLPQVLRGATPVSRLALSAGNAWFAVGPAVLLAVAAHGETARPTVPLAVAMLVAQIAVDLLASAAREALHGAFSVSDMLGEAWLYGVDAALTPIALVVAADLVDEPWTVLAFLPLTAILNVFARERQARLGSLAELNAAYRGTALVLGDVVEADDGYTGEHCRDVVDLALQVGRRLDLPEQRMRNLEFGALLHDVGKVAIPKTIINKPGKLDPHEWAIIKTHTIEGQRMLDRVGGFMCEVGLIVRAHHERWDGGGYPDGLAGAAIPLEARIIACCDTWNAMTTDRSYRAALPEHVAADELRANAGTQFDPDVVDAVIALMAPAPPPLVTA